MKNFQQSFLNNIKSIKSTITVAAYIWACIHLGY